MSTQKACYLCLWNFFHHVDTFTERSWEVWWGGGEEAIKITNYIKQKLFGKEQATQYEIWMNCVSPLQSYSSHEIHAASFNAYTKSLHLYKSVLQIQIQFIFNPDKKSLVGRTCSVHRFSYFINNVKHTEVLRGGSEQLTGCKEASSPHSLTPGTTWPNRQRVATTHHPVTGWVSALYCMAAPFPQLEKKKKNTIQTAAKQHRAFFFRNQLTTSPKNVGKPSE